MTKEFIGGRLEIPDKKTSSDCFKRERVITIVDDLDEKFPCAKLARDEAHKFARFIGADRNPMTTLQGKYKRWRVSWEEYEGCEITIKWRFFQW